MIMKMVIPKLVDDLLRVLLQDSSLKDQHSQLIHELRCLKIYLLCLAKWNYSSIAKDKNFGFVKEFHIEFALRQALVNSERIFTSSDASQLLRTIQHLKPMIKEDCLNFLDSPFRCEFSILCIPDVSVFLHDFPCVETDSTLDVKVKIESLVDILKLFIEVFKHKPVQLGLEYLDFKLHVQACASSAACLSLLYWIHQDEKEENMATRMNHIASDLQKKISPATPEVTRMYLAVLKAPKTLGEDSFTAGKLVIKFFEFFKNNMQVDPEKDDIEMLFMHLMFLITFLMDRPEAKKFGEGILILKKADAVLSEVAALISLLCSGETKVGIAEERNFLLHTFLEKANTIQAEVRKLYAHLFPHPSSCNFPRINVLGFIDSLLENLKELHFHFPKHQIMMLKEELLSLKESNLKDFSVLALQNKHEAIKDLWARIINVAYNAERAVISIVYIKESLWYDSLCLSDVIDEVKLIKGEVKRVQDQHLYDNALNPERSPNPLLPLQANNPIVDKEVVGFENEVEELLGQLTCGSEKLHIISIFGMPGLGKTTLANKVYNDASVRFHFHKCAWSTVSQTFNSKRVLLDILSDVADYADGNLCRMEEEDLAAILKKNLIGRKYLIVMDDIWDVSAWDVLKMSFPENNNGSRIIFTSRNCIMPEPKAGCTILTLNPLSERESWELLRKKLFVQDSCPPDFVEIGRQIAEKCKGLPLSIVLIAGLLKEKIKSLDWWKQVGESLKSLINIDDCMDVLELSYKHLPEFLKPCLLYFGLLEEDEEIRVKRLTLLWISEGFIRKHESKSLEVLAQEYLMHLVARSLVVVTKRSSTGGIKACSVHDLLHDFCRAKGEEEKFIRVTGENEFLYMANTFAHYRVRSQTVFSRSFLGDVPRITASSVRSLFFKIGDTVHDACEVHGYNAWSFTSYFKFLRVLDLHVEVSKFPDDLILLRYLAIGCEAQIPSSIKRIENLETIRLYGLVMKLYVLPLTLWEMQKLRHVFGRVNIPIEFCDHKIAPLEDIQTFSTLKICYKHAEMFLRTIPNVRKLKCEFSVSNDCKGGHHQTVKLDFLSHLESLSICHRSSIYSKLYSCEFYFPSTLKKLNLMDLGLPWSEISPIAKLPNLEVLKLYHCFCGKTWNVGDEEFLKLKCLVLRWLDIKQLNASDGSFRCLERLEVEWCRNFKEIPSMFGSILTLKMIRIEHCSSTLNMSVHQIKEDQVDLGNEHLEILLSE